MAKKPKNFTAATTPANPHDGLYAELSISSEITRVALLSANRGGIPLRLSIGLAAVETTVTGAIVLSEGEGNGDVSARMMAMQAGLLLGAARVSEELDRG